MLLKLDININKTFIPTHAAPTRGKKFSGNNTTDGEKFNTLKEGAECVGIKALSMFILPLIVMAHHVHNIRNTHMNYYHHSNLRYNRKDHRYIHTLDIF